MQLVITLVALNTPDTLKQLVYIVIISNNFVNRIKGKSQGKTPHHLKVN